VATYALTWVGGTLNLVNSAPFLMANSGPAERNHVFAVYTATQPLAAVVGALIGGLLPAFLAGLMGVGPGDPAPYRYALALAIPCYLAGLAAVTRTTEPEPAQAAGLQPAPGSATGTAPAAASTRSPERAFPYGLIAIMMLIAFFKIFSEIATRSFITAYLDDALHAPTSVIGLLYALAQLVAVPAALAAPLLIRRFGLGRTLPLSIAGISASMLPLALVAAVAAAALGLFGVFMAAALSMASLNLFHQQLVEPQWRTAMSGSVTMASAAGMTIVSVVGGYAIAAWGYNAFFAATAVLTFIAPLLYWAYFRRSRRSVSPAETVAAGAASLPRA
jgi:predicted MFS family arabinose efflux permease